MRLKNYMKEDSVLVLSYNIIILIFLLSLFPVANAAVFTVTSTAVENAGATPGDLAASINSANGAQNNTILFAIAGNINYNAGPMPAIVNLPMTIDGNGQALIVRTTPATTPLFNITGTTNAGALTYTNMLSGSPILQAPTAISAGSSVIFNQTAAGNYTYSRVISGAGAINFGTTPGVNITLSVANTFTGGTTLPIGPTLVVGNNNALGTGNLTMSGGSLRSNASRTIANSYTLTTQSFISGSTNLTLNGTGNLGANNLSIINTAGTITLSGIINDGGAGGSITQNGAGGTLLLSGANTYTGGTTLTAGTTRIGNNSALGTGVMTLNGGNLQSNGSRTIANNYTLTAQSFIGGSNNLTINGTGNLGANNLSIINTAGTITLSGIISDGGAGGSITKTGNGTLVLANANTFTGGVTVSDGRVTLGNATALGTGLLTLNGGALRSNTSIDVANNYNVTAPSIIDGNNNLTLNGTGNLGANNLVVNNGGANITLNGIVSDGGAGGSITKTGNGTLVLANANTFTGGVTVSDGRVTLGNAAALGTGLLTLNGGALDSNTNIVVPNNYTVTADSTVSASQNLTLSGNGQLGANLRINRTEMITLSGTITDGISAGSITKMGSSILLITGTNTFSGGVTLTNGTLVAGSSNAFGTGTLNLNGGALQSNTTVNIPNNYAVVSADLNGTENFTLSGNGDIGANNLNVNNSGNSSITLSGIVSGLGGSITKNGESGTTLLLSGANTYTGGTTVNAGTVIVNGTLYNLPAPSPTAPVTINTAGTLKGTGIIRNIVNNFGRVAPGNSIGTLTFQGDYNQFPGGDFFVEINAAGQSSRLDVQANPNLVPPSTGTANINAGTSLTILPDMGVYLPGTLYTILTTEGGVNGTFSTVNLLNGNLGPLMTANVIYNPNSIQILLRRNMIPDIHPIVPILNNLPVVPGSDMSNVLNTLLGLSLSELLEALEVISSQDLVAKNLLVVDNAAFVHRFYKQRLANLRDCHDRTLCMSQVISSTEEICNGGVWIHAYGDFMHQKPRYYSTENYSNRRELGFHSDTKGFLLGIDHRVTPEIFVGMSVGPSESHVKWVQLDSRAHIKSILGTLYGSWYRKGLYIEGMLTGGPDKFSVNRHLAFGDIDRQANNHHGGYEVTPHIGTGYAIDYYAAAIEPYAGVDYILTKQKGYSENGADSLNLNVQKFQSNILRSEVGFSIATTLYRDSETYITPRVRLSYVNKKPLKKRQITAGFVGQSENYSIQCFNYTKKQISPGAGIFAQLNNGGFVSLWYNAEIGSGSNTQEVNLRFGYSF